jgi:hypothetical protein
MEEGILAKIANPWKSHNEYGNNQDEPLPLS